MSEHPSPTAGPADRVHRIRLHGHLPQRWASWFDGLELTLEDDGTTLLEGAVADQAALHGLLAKVRDTGLALISVEVVDTHP